VLSEVNFGDRFDDHFLTSFQAATNIMMQLAFLLAAPEIGFLLLTVVFVIFGFAALRLSSREAAILLAFTGFRVVSPGCSESEREIVDGVTLWPYREEIFPAVSSSVLPRL
jgi:hypothetical protein